MSAIASKITKADVQADIDALEAEHKKMLQDIDQDFRARRKAALTRAAKTYQDRRAFLDGLYRLAGDAPATQDEQAEPGNGGDDASTTWVGTQGGPHG